MVLYIRKEDKSLETEGEQTMIVNGKEMTAKEFALEYIPTPEEFSIHTNVELYFELEDVKAVLDGYFNGATIDDLSDDEINAIIDCHEEYLVDNAYDGNMLAKIIENTANEYGNTKIKRQ